MDSARRVEVDPAILKANHVYGFDSRDLRSRPFNLLRSRLLKLASARQWKMIGVTSAAPGAGKSFIAANISAVISRTPDIDVYLFDFDLRRGSVARTYGIAGDHGLETYLAGADRASTAGDLTSLARRVDGQRLMLMPSYPSGASSAELLAGRAMKQLIQAMRDLPANALCICDLPPVFANDDAALVCGLLDAYVLVVEEGVTTRKQIRDSVGLLAPTPCAGTVLNRYHGGLVSDDYGYGYSQATKYAEYYSGE